MFDKVIYAKILDHLNHFEVHNAMAVCKLWNYLGKIQLNDNKHFEFPVKIPHRPDYNGRPKAWLDDECKTILVRTHPLYLGVDCESSHHGRLYEFNIINIDSSRESPRESPCESVCPLDPDFKAFFKDNISDLFSVLYENIMEELKLGTDRFCFDGFGCDFIKVTDIYDEAFDKLKADENIGGIMLYKGTVWMTEHIPSCFSQERAKIWDIMELDTNTINDPDTLEDYFKYNKKFSTYKECVNFTIKFDCPFCVDF